MVNLNNKRGGDIQSVEKSGKCEQMFIQVSHHLVPQEDRLRYLIMPSLYPSL